MLALSSDEIESKLAAIIGAKDQPGALSEAALHMRLTQLAEQRFALERNEEAAIVAAAEIGLRIDRRPDVDQYAILDIEVIG